MAIRTRRGGDGRLYIREGGRWRTASNLEEMQSEIGGGQAFGLGVASFPGQIAQQYADLQRFAMGGQSATFGPVAPREPGPAEQAAAGVAQFRPGAVLAGQLAPNLVGVNPVAVGRSIAGTGQRMADRVAARALAARQGGGLEMTLGEKTGSRLVQRMESAVASQGGFDRLAERRAALFNRSTARAFGEQADEITPDVLRAANERIGSGMNQLLDRPFNLSPGLRGRLKELGRPGSDLKGLLERLDEAPGPVPGDYVKNLRRELQDRLKASQGTDDLLADDYRQAITGLLDEIEPQLPEGGIERWRQLRQEYKNLQLVESLPEVRAGGQPTPRQLARALAADRGYGKSFIEGRGTVDPATNELMDLTRRLSGMKPLPDSGTATRLGPLVGITAGAATGEDVTDAAQNAALYGGLGYLVPVGLGRASVAAARWVR